MDEEPNGVWLHRAIEAPHPSVDDADTAVDVPAVKPPPQPMSITSFENRVLKGIDVAEAVTQPPSVYDYCRMAVILFARILRKRRDG